MRFRYDPETQLTVCEGMGLLARLRRGRDGSRIIFQNEKGEHLDWVVCRSEGRPLRPGEGGDRLLCPEVLIYHVNWGNRDIAVAEGRAVGRNVVKAYLEFWQSVKGVGCWIDGEPRDALVEVIFN